MIIEAQYHMLKKLGESQNRIQSESAGFEFGGFLKYRMFKKRAIKWNYVSVWRVLRKRLHLKVYKLSIVQHLKQWIVCTPLRVNF
jgi:hypothetical protein